MLFDTTFWSFFQRSSIVKASFVCFKSECVRKNVTFVHV
nr:MAG TPA: hypothetical protein [Caudoviricetes sp.]